MDYLPRFVPGAPGVWVEDYHVYIYIYIHLQREMYYSIIVLSYYGLISLIHIYIYMYIYIYTYMYTHIYIYIYIYIHICVWVAPPSGSRTDGGTQARALKTEVELCVNVEIKVQRDCNVLCFLLCISMSK